MFIESEEMDSVISEYKIREITDCDGTITRGCVLAAVKRVRRMLSGRYDVDRIFSATGEDRDAELLEICKNIALWFLVRRYNVDILYTRVRETYDRDMAYLRELKSVAAAWGYAPWEIDALLARGFTTDEIEEVLYEQEW